jgi:hypothetical protein
MRAPNTPPAVAPGCAWNRTLTFSFPARGRPEVWHRPRRRTCPVDSDRLLGGQFPAFDQHVEYAIAAIASPIGHQQFLGLIRQNLEIECEPAPIDRVPPLPAESLTRRSVLTLEPMIAFGLHLADPQHVHRPRLERLQTFLFGAILGLPRRPLRGIKLIQIDGVPPVMQSMERHQTDIARPARVPRS